MIKTFIFAATLTLTLWGISTSVQAQQPGPPRTNSADRLMTEFELCLSDALIGLAVARDYFLSSRSQQEALETAASAGEAGTIHARRLFDGSQAGEIQNAYQFAQKSLFSCMHDAQFPVDNEISKESAQACFYRSDALFYAFSSRAIGKSKDEARMRIENILKNRSLLPSTLVANMVDLVYSRPDDISESSGGIRQFIKSCFVASNDS